jgi:stalled ribosome alternative rescue factor ArfA
MRSAAAKELAKPLYHQRIVLAKKGRGSYNRKKQKETSND